MSVKLFSSHAPVCDTKYIFHFYYKFTILPSYGQILFALNQSYNSLTRFVPKKRGASRLQAKQTNLLGPLAVNLSNDIAKKSLISSRKSGLYSGEDLKLFVLAHYTDQTFLMHFIFRTLFWVCLYL